MHKLGKKLASLSVTKIPGLDQLQSQSSSDSTPPSSAFISNTQSLPPHVFHRYRKHRGVNLGSWFVFERWISGDHPFRRASAPGQSDLDIAAGTYPYGIIEEHFREWITGEDWDWLQARGVNAVRIPIGFYHLCGLNDAYVKGTDFEPHAQTFRGAWHHIKFAIQEANHRGIGVLIDLHAAPGKQNNDNHSGTSSSPTFFSKTSNQTHCLQILNGLIRTLTSLDHPNLIGIELLNEPAPPSDSTLQKFYEKAIEVLAEVDPTVPVYLSECWKLDSYADWIRKRKTQRPEQMIVLDHHLYRCFTPQDHKTPVAAHTASLTNDDADTPKTFARASEKLRKAGSDFIVGEWSAALNPKSLEGAEHDAQTKYARAQLELFEKHCAGHFFWTYKKSVSGDRGWSFRDAVESRTLPRWVGGMRLKRAVPLGDDEEERSTAARDSAAQEAYDTHTKYWAQFPGKYEHHRFREGFLVGWDDANVFFLSGTPQSPGTAVPELGFIGAWLRRRTTDFGKGFWEFEHGFNQGVTAARTDFEQTYCT
ncbi:glycoside hydrolase family 5 protein [Flagelloscypha sp. PMI_526]|nr:glycoside hydrolase family 5 protein [Flagelloscypha sp. PMI_526]